MTENRLQRLIELASKATPGPWGVRKVPGDRYRIKAIDADEFIATVSPWTEETEKCDAAYIAAASPDTVQQLAEHLAALVEKEPLVENSEGLPWSYCAYCRGHFGGWEDEPQRQEHDADCPWLLAKQWSEG